MLDDQLQADLTTLVESFAKNVHYDMDSGTMIFDVPEGRGSGPNRFSLGLLGSDHDYSLVLMTAAGVPLATFHAFSHATYEMRELVEHALLVLTEGYRYIG